jgi:hypothetical protein
MVPAMETPRQPDPVRLSGEVVYLFAFDIAYELSRELPDTLLGAPMAEYRLDASKRNPKHLVFFRPRMIRLPAVERVGPLGPVSIHREVKVLPVGVISIRVRVPFEVDRFEDLVAFHDLRFRQGTLGDEVRELAAQVRDALRPHTLRTVDAMSEEEAYTVFCLRSPVRSADGNTPRAEVWLDAHRREVAALLNQEEDHGRLSRQETLESTSRSISYYEDDLAVIDWDAALVVDDPAEWEETLYVLELANLQLAELEAYDRLLDTTLERSYRDLGVSPLRSKRVVLTELRELRIDMTRFRDELSNISKFLGDWHLARVYEAAATRFHLGDWHRSVEDKLKTVGELHELLKSDQSNRWMMILEVTVVLLFILDVAFIVFGGKN